MRTYVSVDQAEPAALPVLAKVGGWPINIASQQQAVAEICTAARQGISFATFTLNLDHLVKLRRDARFRRAYSLARFVTADGAPVARIASWQGTPIKRTTGADLVIPLAQEAARSKLPIFLFGTTNDVLARAGRVLAESSDDQLDIVGTQSPPQGFDPEGPEADKALDRIAQSGARLCFVALGAPKQELFAARAVERGIPVGFICVGAALDFLVGAQSRAPKGMQDRGLEWLWRLGTNPRRLASRYASCAMILFDLLIWHRNA